ncbi:alpha-amylase family protein [Thalassoglobus polymorphus]|uniref:Glycosyl hydrolase-like 10 domain-containing protein n=1 Tax=Thalassoglobus polymorphus TaxID=2527994 RepID=A0A517QMY0_9PLAN|nr:hypothetical protein [Thalassoglobus polymorphus]QDT32917.1 hypothetical protein Mal48_21650 [Thalassoglobus polymorphus]
MSFPVDQPQLSGKFSRRSALKTLAGGTLSLGTMAATLDSSAFAEAPEPEEVKPRPWIQIRGIYGGFPDAILQRGETPADYGINAIWIGSGGLNQKKIEQYHQLGLKVFAEYNSMHFENYLKKHPQAAPIGTDGLPSPAPHGWQGVSPFDAGYRKNRMDEFRRVLETFEVDGIWLDYHHSHASWERAEPVMPDTDFSPTALKQFQQKTGIQLPDSVPAAAKQLLGPHRDAWTQFRCDVFTDWVREYREILDAVRPQTLLGTFHCPWSTDDYEGAIRHKLAIDLPAQAKYLDVFSTMPYHARFGHPQEPGWVADQTKSLGNLLNLKGEPHEKQKIWPIVQLADWGEPVAVDQVESVLDAGTTHPSTGVMVFHWSGVSKDWQKVDALGRFYRGIRPRS